MFDTSFSPLRAVRRLGLAATVPALLAACTPTAPSESLPRGETQARKGPEWDR